MSPPPERIVRARSRGRSGATRSRAAADPQAARPATVARFTLAERIAHWVNAALFAVTIATGIMFRFGVGQSIVTDRAAARLVHVVAGFAIIGVFVMSLLGRRGAALRRDIRRLARFTPDDTRWLRTRGRARNVRLGKFNPGQKLNAIFVAAASVAFAATGSIMYWNQSFSTDLRTGADLVHGWFAYGIFAVVAGHIVLALRDRQALQGITTGRVSVDWARDHRPRWYDDVRGTGAGAVE